MRNGDAGGIRITGASPSITGNIVTANAAYEGAGFYIGDSSALIEGNVIRGNIAGYGGGGGFYLGYASGLEVRANTIEFNASHMGGAMYLFTAVEPLIVNNVFRGNRATTWGGGAIDIVSDSWPFISQNVFADSEANFGPGQTVPNLVMAKVGAGGVVNLFNSSGSTHIVADIAGWYA